MKYSVVSVSQKAPTHRSWDLSSRHMYIDHLVGESIEKVRVAFLDAIASVGLHMSVGWSPFLMR